MGSFEARPTEGIPEAGIRSWSPQSRLVEYGNDERAATALPYIWVYGIGGLSRAIAVALRSYATPFFHACIWSFDPSMLASGALIRRHTSSNQTQSRLHPRGTCRVFPPPPACPACEMISPSASAHCTPWPAPPQTKGHPRCSNCSSLRQLDGVSIRRRPAPDRRCTGIQSKPCCARRFLAIHQHCRGARHRHTFVWGAKFLLAWIA